LINYFCTRHNFVFLRHVKSQTGYCWECKKLFLPIDKCQIEDLSGKRFINIYPIQKFHEIYSDSRHGNLQKIEGSGNMKATFATKIQDGKYNGKIIRIEERTDPYEYTDFVCEFTIDNKKIELKFGCPTNLVYDEETQKPTSKLAMLLEDFGFEFNFEQDIKIKDLEMHFIGLQISSLIANEKSKKGGVFATMKTMTPKLETKDIVKTKK
jgi:hypothetical protein